MLQNIPELRIGQKPARIGPGGFVGSGHAQNLITLLESIGGADDLPVGDAVKPACRAVHERKKIFVGIRGLKARLQMRRKQGRTGQRTGQGATKFPSAHAPASPFRDRTDLHYPSLMDGPLSCKNFRWSMTNTFLRFVQVC